MTRPAGQGSDGAMARALEAGLPAHHLAVLMAARRDWWARNERPAERPDPLTGEAAAAVWRAALDDALAHPAADAFDEVFVAAMRRHRGAP